MTTTIPTRQTLFDDPNPVDKALPTEAVQTQELLASYGRLNARALIRTMVEEVFPGRIAAVSSFGSEAAVLLHLLAAVDRRIPVIFLDTEKHFPQTLAYRDDLVAHLGLTDVRVVRPESDALLRVDPDGGLWRNAPDACCGLRKVEPLARALDGFSACFTGRKRFQGPQRAALEPIESQDGRIKINPLASWTQADVEATFDVQRLPRHPLVAEGFHSIGCGPCTQRSVCSADPRSGRWPGLAKTECGIHQGARAPQIAAPGRRANR